MAGWNESLLFVWVFEIARAGESMLPEMLCIEESF